MVTLYIIYFYLSHLFIPAKIFFSIWRPLTSVKDSVVTVHCDKCCGKGGISFLSPQNKAMLMFTHRCLCLREFYSRKDHFYKWLAKHRIQILCELTKVCDLQLGFEQSPLSDGSILVLTCDQVELAGSSATFLHPSGSTKEDPWLPFPVGLRAWLWPPQTTATQEPPSAMVPPPPPSGSCETSPVLAENGKQRRGHNWTLIAWNILAKIATSKLLLSLSWCRSESWKIPSNGKYCSDGTLLLFPLIWKVHLLPNTGAKEHLPNGMPEQQRWESPTSLFSVSLRALNSFLRVYPSWTTTDTSISTAFISWEGNANKLSGLGCWLMSTGVGLLLVFHTSWNHGTAVTAAVQKAPQLFRCYLLDIPGSKILAQNL